MIFITNENSYYVNYSDGALEVIGSGSPVRLIGSNASNVIVKSLNITDSTATPETPAYSGIEFRDSNNIRYGKIEGIWRTDGTTGFGFNASRVVNGSSVYASAVCRVDASGNTHFSFPMCTSRATTTSSASNDRVVCCVENYINGTSWYRVYSDNWCEQGGAFSGTSITFIKPFINTNYSFTGVSVNTSQNGAANTITNIKTTGITYYTMSNSGGRWRAEGYI